MKTQNAKKLMDTAKEVLRRKFIAINAYIKKGKISSKQSNFYLKELKEELNLKQAEYTFFSSAHATFSRIDHILGHKSSLGKFKKIEIISSIFSDHNAMRLEISYRKKTVKNTNTWRLNSVLLNNQEITEEIKEEIKKYIETNDNENMTTQNLWNAAKAVLNKREVYSNSISPQETRKISNKQLNPTPKATRERRTKKT